MKKYKKIWGLLIIALGMFYLVPMLISDELSNGQASKSIYGKTDINDYLSGRFSPESHSLFVALDIPDIYGRKQYLRKEVADAFKKMSDDFSKDHPKIKFYVRSATRTYREQARIWNRKWRANSSIKDKRKRALKILEYSAMPGTSRHHWGTDFDIDELNFDIKELDFDINELNNEYYLAGNGKIIYSWLKDNAAKYGFYQPYTADRTTGHNEEKWHWSYKPLASQFIRDWNETFAEDYRKLKGFYGDGFALPMAKEYVNAINPDCL